MENNNNVPNKRNKALNKKLVLNHVIIIIFSIFLAMLVKLIDKGWGDFAQAVTQSRTIIQIFALAAVLALLQIVFLYYILQTKKDILENGKLLAVLLTAVLITLLLSYILGKYASVYLMPLALAGLLIGILIDKRAALMANIFINLGYFLCFVILYGIHETLISASAMLTGIVAGTYMILMMEKTYTRMRFLLNGLFIAAFIAPVAMLSSAVVLENDWQDILYSGMWSFLSAVLSVALFITVLPAFEKIFRLSTNFGLEEICSFDAPLLKRLSTEAPGTFNHSLSVGNLAQLCALAIGENPQLAKAAAYYHDVGKLRDPLCYVENQKDYNPHDDFIPEVSVYVITQHTNWGYELIKKENLPDVIADIAKEHHGTTPVNYFYNKVKKLTEERVDSSEFCYDGPIPSGRIGAIIMIADTVEAASRSQGISTDEKELRAFIHELIEEKRRLGQFDNCGLTLRQLKQIEDTLVEALPGVSHTRIAYNTEKEDKKEIS
jgi:putative nucleotidyltransferase with HDIG domain